MEIKEIQDLIKFVAKSGVSEVSIEQKDFKITIKTGKEKEQPRDLGVHATIPAVQAPAAVPLPPQPGQVPAGTAAAEQAPAPAASSGKGGKEAEAPGESKLVTVKSPMIGTFYRSSSPDKPPLVNVGDEISTGQVLCIIEAMKLFNEIESELSGKIVKVLVENASPVEYDQPLFLVDPS